MTNPKAFFALHEKTCLLLVAIIFSVFPCFLSAQNAIEKGMPFVTNFNPKQYHGGVQNWSIVEDKKGFMYFGNASYVIQYDGVRWRKISTRPGGAYGSTRGLTRNKQGIIYYAGLSDFGYVSVDDSLGEMKAHSLLNYVPESMRNFADTKTVFVTDDGFVYFQSRERIFRFKEDSSGKIIAASLKTWEPKTKFMYAFYVDGEYFVHQQALGLYKMSSTDSLEFIPGSEFLGKERMQVFVPYTNGKDNNKQFRHLRFCRCAAWTLRPSGTAPRFPRSKCLRTDCQCPRSGR